MEKIIGLTIGEARQHHKNIRIVEENGAKLAVTSEYRPERINVAIKNGKIFKIVGAG